MDYGSWKLRKEIGLIGNSLPLDGVTILVKTNITSVATMIGIISERETLVMLLLTGQKFAQTDWTWNHNREPTLFFLALFGGLRGHLFWNRIQHQALSEHNGRLLKCAMLLLPNSSKAGWRFVWNELRVNSNQTFKEFQNCGWWHTFVSSNVLNSPPGSKLPDDSS